jgi:hypothetical protein
VLVKPRTMPPKADLLKRQVKENSGFYNCRRIEEQKTLCKPWLILAIEHTDSCFAIHILNLRCTHTQFINKICYFLAWNNINTITLLLNIIDILVVHLKCVVSETPFCLHLQEKAYVGPNRQSL